MSGCSPSSNPPDVESHVKRLVEVRRDAKGRRIPRFGAAKSRHVVDDGSQSQKHGGLQAPRLPCPPQGGAAYGIVGRPRPAGRGELDRSPGRTTWPVGRVEAPKRMRVHLVNPSDLSFGTAVITPRWLFVLAAATPKIYGDPLIVDETLEHLVPESIAPGDVVGIGIHTGNALARLRAWQGGARARCMGRFWRHPLHALSRGGPRARPRARRRPRRRRPGVGQRAGRLRGRRAAGTGTRAGGWKAMPSCPRAGTCCRPRKYMWGSVQTVRGCPKHCSFCSVWKTDGQKPRQRGVDVVVREIVELRRQGFRFILLADDNFYPVSMADLQMARRRADKARLDRADGPARRAVRADASAGPAAKGHGVLHADHHGGRRRHRSSSTRCGPRTSTARWWASSR